MKIVEYVQLSKSSLHHKREIPLAGISLLYEPIYGLCPQGAKSLMELKKREIILAMISLFHLGIKKEDNRLFPPPRSSFFAIFLIIFDGDLEKGKFCPLGYDIIEVKEGETMQENMKKTIIVHVLKVLYNYTSYDYPATQTSITVYLNEIGIPCTRKTVGRNIKYLIECGLPIKRKHSRQGGYYYDFENDRFFVRKAIQQEAEK